MVYKYTYNCNIEYFRVHGNKSNMCLLSQTCMHVHVHVHYTRSYFASSDKADFFQTCCLVLAINF